MRRRERRAAAWCGVARRAGLTPGQQSRSQRHVVGIIIIIVVIIVIIIIIIIIIIIVNNQLPSHASPAAAAEATPAAAPPPMLLPPRWGSSQVVPSWQTQKEKSASIQRTHVYPMTVDWFDPQCQSNMMMMMLIVVK